MYILFSNSQYLNTKCFSLIFFLHMYYHEIVASIVPYILRKWAASMNTRMYHRYCAQIKRSSIYAHFFLIELSCFCFCFFPLVMENQTPKKPRILCLHGFRTSGQILKNLIQKRWPETVLQKLDLFFQDAPYPAQGKSEVEGFYDPPYYEWFQDNHVGFTLTTPKFYIKKIVYNIYIKNRLISSSFLLYIAGLQ